MKVIYKGWEIEKSDYAQGYFEAHNLNDCDAPMLWGKSVEEIKTEINEILMFKAQPIDFETIEYWHFVEWDCYPYSKKRRTR